MTDDSAASVPAFASAEPGRMSPIDVAVNLLWCVPGEVGGLRAVPRASAARSRVAADAVRADAVLPAVVRRRPPRTRLAVSRWSRADHRHEPSSAGARRAHVVAPAHPRRRHRPPRRRNDCQRSAVARSCSRSTICSTSPIPSTSRRRSGDTSNGRFPRSVGRAAVVAVPTEYVRTTVIDAYGVDPDRVVVVPHGVESSLGADAPSAFDLRRDYGLGAGPMIVYPAITHPHKNHRFLLEVMARALDRPGPAARAARRSRRRRGRGGRRHRSAGTRTSVSFGPVGSPTPIATASSPQPMRSCSRASTRDSVRRRSRRWRSAPP